MVGEITAAQLKNSVSRKRLHKRGTVAVGEKIKLKLEKRKESAGRRVLKHRRYDETATQAVSTLTSLDREDLANFLKRAVKLLNGGDPIEWMQVSQSSNQLDRALWFLERLERGDAPYHEALCRNQRLCEAFLQWREKANRILRKGAWPALQKIKEKKALKRKLNAPRRSSGG